MRISFTFKSNRYMAVLTVAVSAAVALPVLLLPVGIRSGTPAEVLVGKAYAAVYPYDPEKKTVLVEQWALGGGGVNGLETENTGGTTPTPATGSSDNVTTVTPTESANGTDTATPTEGAGQQQVDENGLIVIGEGQTVSASYIDGATPAPVTDPYAQFFTATIVQHEDADGRPIEILDPSTFVSDNTTVYIKTSDTIIKSSPDMAAVTVAKINKGSEVTRISIGDSWAKIRTEDGTEGYVPLDNLSEQMLFIDIDRTVWVDTDGLKLRAEPSTGADIVKTLSKNSKLHCTAVAAKWYHVTTEDGTDGYVYIAYTTQTPPPTPTPVPTKKPSKSGSSSSSPSKTTGNKASLPTITGVNGDSIVNICVSMLGVPYVWAGESRDGVDCSGLVVYSYRQIGISLPHQSNSLKNCGISISRADIAVGDIVCWDVRGSSDTVEHVGIYVGGGQVIHASSTRDRVEYGNVDMYPIVSIRRIIA